MIGLLGSFQPILELILINSVLAFSQYIVLRAGVFSLATAGFASAGAYCAAILTVKVGMPWPLAMLIVAALGTIMGGILSVPLGRLRGVYQAIATLAFVQILLSLALYAEPLTGGAMGMNGIPRLLSVWHLLLLAGLVFLLVWSLSSTGMSRVFDAARQEETVSVSLGIRVADYHRIGFLLSGAIGAVGGAMMALRNYSLVPEDFGFHLVILVLTIVVLGSRVSIFGPILGAVILTILPEIARPFAEHRMLLNGLVMILVTVFYPNGVADGLRYMNARRRLAREAAQ